LSSGASFVIVEPAPIVAPTPISVRHLFTPS